MVDDSERREITPENYGWCTQEEPGKLRVLVWVTPNARQEKVFISESEQALILHIKTPPVEGKANREVIRLLSELFKVPKRNITLVSGEMGRTKIFLIQK